MTKIADLRAQTPDQLADELLKLKKEQFNLRFQAATGQLETQGRLRNVRKDIARIYTVLQERNLGIVPEPEAAEKSEEKKA